MCMCVRCHIAVWRVDEWLRWAGSLYIYGHQVVDVISEIYLGLISIVYPSSDITNPSIITPLALHTQTLNNNDDDAYTIFTLARVRDAASVYITYVAKADDLRSLPTALSRARFEKSIEWKGAKRKKDVHVAIVQESAEIGRIISGCLPRTDIELSIL